MKIGQAAALSGLSVKTVRYYAEIGLVIPYADSQTGYRDYSIEDVSKLQFIGKARRFDFSIDECRELLSLYQDKTRSSSEVKALTLEKMKEIDGKLEELNILKTQLSELVDSCNGDSRPDCPILDALSGHKD